MKIAVRFASRPLSKPLALFVLLAVVFFLLLGMLYRSFSHVDVVVASIDDPAGTAQLMQRLEAFDADYRVQQDGSILVDGGDIARLIRQGVTFSDVRMQTHRFAQGAMLLLLLATAVSMLYIWLIHVIRTGGRDAGEKDAEENGHRPSGEPEEGPAGHEKSRTPSKLFEAEHPQTVAVYLLSLGTDAAAEALEVMHSPLRAHVWERMALSGECDGALREKVSELFELKSHRLKKRMRPAEVTEKMVGIYRRLSPATRADLLARMRREHSGDGIIVLLEAENTLKSGNKEA